MSNAKPKKELLGKGIRSLLQGIESEINTPAAAGKPELLEKTHALSRVPLDKIEVNPKQPRKDFDETALAELAASIKTHDIIQPLTVSRIAQDRYRLIAGERRFRASKLAGLKDVPVYIREANDQQLLELALLENLQREDLNAIEVALSYKRLMDECDLTQEQVAERMGKERSTVTNYLRLLKLPPDIIVAVRSGQISMGHARALVNVDVVDKQLSLFKDIMQKGLSVRQTEELVRTMYRNRNKAQKPPVKGPLPPDFKKMEDNMTSHFGTKVKLKHQRKGNGQIVLEYYSIAQLTSLLEKMKISDT